MKHLRLASVVALLFIVNSISAQVFRVSLFNQEGIVMGDFAKKEINNSSAGYADYASSTGLELNYYLPSNLGFGIRGNYNYYGRDYETYETDLIKMLGLTDDQYDVTQTYAFWSFGSDFGISYQLDLSKKLQLEPYFYLGFNILTSPLTSVVYLENNVTYTYKTKPMEYVGFSYSPGVKLNWNILDYFGLNFSVEYDGNSFMEDDERTMMYSYNTLEISDTKKSYNINSLNFGLGLAFKFGKGLKE